MNSVDGFNTRAVRSERAQRVEEVPLAPPIWQVSEYLYESAEHYADVINERREGQVYGRYGNLTLETLADTLASLEGAEAGWIFSSGQAAVHATLMHVAGAGKRIVAARTLYGGTYGLFTSGAERAGIEAEFFDATTGETPALDGVTAIFVESIANPNFEVADLEALGGLGVPLIVDNTVPTPALLNPIELGAELVVHSTSKYIGGHHDLIGGAVLGPADRISDIRHLAIQYGTTASALESWLALRGVATLGVRMDRHCANASAVAEFLEKSGKLERVSYPGLPSHPQYERAKRLLRGFGGMVAADLGFQDAAWAFMDALRLARVGSSFGGVRSEVTHPATTSHRQFSKEDREAAGITDGLVRISIGIEDEQDLIADFEQALGSL
jgi:methionine-gamma-lyase